MSPQEIQALQDFLNQLMQVRGIAKDPQAASWIASAVAQQPDAAYLLVQRALMLEQALASAKVQIAGLENQLKSQLQTAPAPGFFDSNGWGNSLPAAAASTARSPVAPQNSAAAPPALAAPVATPAAAPGFFGGGMGGVLGSVATTAAGVAGGAFLFQGIEHMMHPNGGAGFMNQSAPPPQVENTTVNNYYASADASDNGTGDSADDTNDAGDNDAVI